MRWLSERRGGIKRGARSLVATVAGAVILYHEIWISDTAEPLLVFLGLWLLGIPPAVFFDGLRRVGQQAQSEVERTLGGDADGAQVPPGAPSPQLPSADTDGTA